MRQVADVAHVITGAAHGQGRATALALAKEGVHIAAYDIAKPLSYPAYKMGSSDELESLKKDEELYAIFINSLSFLRS